MLVHRLRRWPNIEPALGQGLLLLLSDAVNVTSGQAPPSLTSINCLACYSDAHWAAITANTKHLYSIYTMSAQRLRRWSNIV